MKLLFKEEHKGIRVAFLHDRIILLHEVAFNKNKRTDISFRDCYNAATVLSEKRVQCDKIELFEVDDAGIKINIYENETLIGVEFYILNKSNENSTTIYINEQPVELLTGFL